MSLGPAPRWNGGFTLLELLVAVALFASVMAMAYGGLAAMMRSEEQVLERSNQWRDLQLALQLLETDLMQAVDRQVRDEQGDALPAMRLTDGNTVELEFSRLGSGLLVGPVSQLQRVGYRWDGKRLVRRSWLYADRIQASVPRDNILLEELTDLRFSFFGVGDTEHSGWPVSSGRSPSLPRAVRLQLVHGKLGEIERLFLVHP